MHKKPLVLFEHISGEFSPLVGGKGRKPFLSTLRGILDLFLRSDLCIWNKKDPSVRPEGAFLLVFC